MRGKFRELVENCTLQEAMGGAGIDDANGVLMGVSLLTGLKESANKTYYTASAMAEAVSRYEGAKMFLDHPKEKGVSRSVLDFGGVYKNVRVDGQKIRGDLHLLESKRSTVMPIAKMRPDGIGFSIKDRGFGKQKDGVFFVDGFEPAASFSIDMVIDPSTNKDLFESTQIETEINTEEGGQDMDLKSLTVELLGKERPELVESIQNAGKAAILKELEEAKANGSKSDAVAAKLTALLEADFSKDVSEAVRKMIMPDAITLDAAKAIITGQKELIEAMGKKNKATNGQPVVTGLGQRKEEDIQEGAKGDLPSADDILASFRR